MTVTIPDEFCELLEQGSQREAEVRARLAAHFYTTGTIGVVRAARLAGMKRQEFESWLHAHSIDLPWDDADLAQELTSVRQRSDSMAD